MKELKGMLERVANKGIEITLNEMYKIMIKKYYP